MRHYKFYAIAATLAVVACSPESPTGPASDDPGLPSATNPGLECGAPGYPCSLSAVSPEILQRSDSLGEEVLAMWDEGSSAAEAASWLAALPDMAEVQSDDFAVRFRLEGGRGTWILREDALGVSDPNGAAPLSYRTSADVPEPSQDVVAPESEEKRALVLSPFLWQFGGFDEGPIVAQILSGTRGYEGRVEFRANRDSTSKDVGVGSFKGWQKYQVVHVASHGKRLCNDVGSECRAVIFAGLLESDDEAWEELQGIEETGVEYVKVGSRGLELVPDGKTRAVGLSADFFWNEYSGGLDDALVFLNGCETFGPQATDLVDAIQGSGAVVFGWTEVVKNYAAGNAAVALYNELSVGGYPAEVAYSKLEGLRFSPSWMSRSCGCRITPELRMSKRPRGGDLHIREVVTLLDPSSEEPLTPASRVRIVGTQGDGVPDDVPYLIQVDGILPEFAGDVMVHFSVDGLEAEPVALTSGEANEEDQWTVRGTLDLGEDLEEDRQADFRAWAELHSDGESNHETPSILTGEGGWRFEATHKGFWTAGHPGPYTPPVATADLMLSLEDGQSATEPKRRFVVTSGSVDFDYNHTSGSCSYKGGVIFEVTPEVMTPPPSPLSHLTFDAAVAPKSYTGYLSTTGPAFTVEATCGGDYQSTRSHTPTTVWLNLLDDLVLISGDGDVISDTYRAELPFPELGYSWVQETVYTLTRIK